MSKITITWAGAALVRAIKTMAQVILSMITIGVAIDAINWKYIVSVALTASICSILTSLAGLPEVGSDGVLKIDTTGPVDAYLLSLDTPLEGLASKSVVKLTVDPNAILSQK